MTSHIAKSIIIASLLLSFVKSTAQESDTLKFLFFGNSITLTNDLPGLFENMANSTGKNVSITNGCIGGNLLDHLLENPSSVAKIDNEQWDYVVLQLTPGNFTGGIQDSKIAVEEFVALIKENNPCSEIVFMMPWIFSDNIPSKIQSVQLETLLFANEFNARVNPAGLLWNIVSTNHPEIDFYTDLIHPTYIGSYLAACGLYASIYKENLIDITFTGLLSNENSLICKNTATNTILNNLPLWNLNYFAHFDYSIDNNKVTFKKVTSNASFYEWDFGDGKNSSIENPIHQYADTGSFNVQLIIKSDTCFSVSDTLSKTVIIKNLVASISDIVFKPNPFNDHLQIDLRQVYTEVTIEIFDLFSKRVFLGKYNSTDSIDLFISELSAGSYLLTMKLIDGETTILTKKIIKH